MTECQTDKALLPARVLLCDHYYIVIFLISVYYMRTCIVSLRTCLGYAVINQPHKDVMHGEHQM